MYISNILETCFYELGEYLKSSSWFGREHEVVNLFVLQFLVNQIGKGPLILPTQIGIEVTVKQLPGENRKNLVNKDLVIWPKQYQVVWNTKKQPINVPLAIVEWKVNSINKCSYDINWLKEYTQLYPSVIGYSVCAFIEKERGVSFKRIENGKIVT